MADPAGAAGTIVIDNACGPPSMSSINLSLRNNLVANYLGHGWTALMGIAFIPWYIKLLGIEAYGLIGVFAFAFFINL